MTSIDPQQLEHLRNLPSGYLLDLLADAEDLDEVSIQMVLQERGYSEQDIDEKTARRRQSRWLRGPALWRLVRWFSLACTLVIGLFNLICFYRLLQADDPMNIPLLFFSVVCSGFGFFLGYKMTAHLYQGGRHHLFCGFPVPVGYIDLQTGKEEIPSSPPLLVRMMINALVGVNLAIFPLMLIYLGVQ